MAKKEPKGIVIPVVNTGALHNELRSHAGMKQVFEVQIDGKPVKLSGMRIASRALPKPYGTFILDLQRVKVKAKRVLPMTAGEITKYNADRKAAAKVKRKPKKPK